MNYKSNQKNLTLLFCLTFITIFSTNIFSMQEREKNDSENRSNYNPLLESTFGDFFDYDSANRNLSESTLAFDILNEEAKEESRRNPLTESTLDFGAFTKIFGDEEEIDSKNNLELGTNLKDLPNEIKLYIIEQLITKRTPLNIVIKAIKSFLFSCKTNNIFIEQNSIILANKIFQIYGPIEILLLPTIPTILKNIILENVAPVNLESIYIEFIKQIILSDKLNIDEKREKANLFFGKIQEIKNACIYCSFLGKILYKSCTICRRLENLEVQIESYLNGKINLNDFKTKINQ